MTNANLFEKASRGQYRYQYRGVITTEDLWNLTVQQLDSIFKALNKELKQVTEESLLQTKTAADEIVEDKIEIIKHIVSIKVAEADAKIQEKAKREQRAKILEAIESKQDEALQGKSVDELKTMLENL